jgi:hypothetical protein
MSTSLDGLGATLPPPITYIWPLKLSALVSPVALGMAVMVEITSATGSYLKEFVVSVRMPAVISLPPPV